MSENPPEKPHVPNFIALVRSAVQKNRAVSLILLAPLALYNYLF